METEFLIYIFLSVLLATAFLAWALIDRKIERTLCRIEKNQHSIRHSIKEIQNPQTTSRSQITESFPLDFFLDDQKALELLSQEATERIHQGVNPNAIHFEMDKEIDIYQHKTGNNIRFKYDPASRIGSFQIDNQNRIDYLNVKKPNDVRFLTGKVDGVPFGGINLYKPNAYDCDNAAIARTLRYVANLVEAAPVRLADQDKYSL